MSHRFRSSDKSQRLNDLANCVSFCNLCSRMEHRNRVLSNLNGDINSKVLFIAEAPGRLGADRTGIPLYGDKTGNNFEKLLYSIGWNRNDVFITNAVLCNPRDSKGNNDTPNKEEVHNCSIFLNMTINLIRPQLIVTLGRIALESLSFIHPHSLALNKSKGMSFSWNSYNLYPLYHTGPRAIIHRSTELQLSDFKRLPNLIKTEPSTSIIDANFDLCHAFKINTETEIDRIKTILLYFLSKLFDISFSKATKLLFLFDYNSITNYGFSFSGATYLRQVEGPWLPKLKDIANSLNGELLSLYFIKNKPYLKINKTDIDFSTLNAEQRKNLDQFLLTYGNISDRGLKIAAYRTAPMQYILKQENEGVKMLNKVVIKKDKTILDIENTISETLLF